MNIYIYIKEEEEEEEKERKKKRDGWCGKERKRKKLDSFIIQLNQTNISSHSRLDIIHSNPRKKNKLLL
jgi:hypothetical protein